MKNELVLANVVVEGNDLIFTVQDGSSEDKFTVTFDHDLMLAGYFELFTLVWNTDTPLKVPVRSYSHTWVDILIFIRENIRNQWSIECVRLDEYKGISNVTCPNLYFSNESDALIFKLKFG